MKLFLAIAAAAIVLAAGCGSSHPAPAAPTPAPTSAAARPGSWTTYHRDASRSGAEPAGPALARTRRLWGSPVDGRVYAEPLAVGSHVIAATERNSLYAFDAASGRQLWRTNVGTPVNGGDLPCGDINPSGITGTPVADPRRGLVYAVALERPARHELVALDIATGQIRWRRGIDAPGADPRVEQQRGALSLSHGRVYVPYGGLYGDCGAYHGYVVAVSVVGAGGRLLSYQVPARREAGIWAASGAATDAAGNVFVTTGNGSSSSFDFGNAVTRLTSSLRRADFFAPRNAASLNRSDTDFGSVGPLLLPGGRLFDIGKDGVGYLLDAHRLGGIGRSISSPRLCGGGGAYGGLAYARGTIFVPCASDGVVAATLRGKRVSYDWTGPSFQPGPPIVAGGAVWSVDLGGGELYALDAGTGRVRFHARIGQAAQFSTPAAGGGRVYVAAGGRVLAFGG